MLLTKNSAELQGLEYRVKTPSSTYEKMHEREGETEIGEMKDVIRYTEIYPPDKLAEGTNASLSDFKSRGYTVDRVKNTWDDENTAYRGINANLTSPDGQTFEVQFHTQESFELKNGELHSLLKNAEQWLMMIQELLNLMIECLNCPQNLSDRTMLMR